jgi:hypothetical protein
MRLFFLGHRDDSRRAIWNDLIESFKRCWWGQWSRPLFANFDSLGLLLKLLTA